VGAAWLGLLTILVLAPLAAGLAGTAAGARPQALVPSPEIAWAWLVAIAGTCLFASLGVVRGEIGAVPSGSGTAPARRQPRMRTAGLLAAVLAVVSAGILGGATLVNAAAARDRPANASPYGPTDPTLPLPACDGAIRVGATATLTARLTGEADRDRLLGTATIEGARSGDDIAWMAKVAIADETGPAGVVALAEDGWQREPGEPWTSVPATALIAEHLDATVLATALEPERLLAAEDRGLVLVEGAPARHCRVAIDGQIFRAAFPQVRWFAGDRSLHRWRGEIDYYLFGDGQLGLVEAWVNGEAEPLTSDAIQATIRTTLAATNRDQPKALAPPEGG
jgi:hypothetical protein